MKYVCLIYQGMTPLPGMRCVGRTQPGGRRRPSTTTTPAVTRHAGVTPGPPLGRPDDATTRCACRAAGALTTDGPFASTKEALRRLLRASRRRHLDAAIEVAAPGPGGSPGRRHRDQAGRDLLVTREKGTV